MSFPSYGTCQAWVLFQPCLCPWSTPCLPLGLHPGSPARTSRLPPIDCQLRVVSASNRKKLNTFCKAEVFKSASKPASSQHISILKQPQAIVVLSRHAEMWDRDKDPPGSPSPGGHQPPAADTFPAGGSSPCCEPILGAKEVRCVLDGLVLHLCAKMSFVRVHQAEDTGNEKTTVNTSLGIQSSTSH